RAFARWEAVIDRGIAWYIRRLDAVMRYRLPAVLAAVVTLAAVVALLGTRLRREFFPEVDAGAFELYARAPSGTRIEATDQRVAQIEALIRRTITAEDLQLII